MLLFCEFANSSYGFGNYTTVTLKAGQSYSLSASNFNTSHTHMVSGEAVVVSYNSSGPYDFTVYAVKSGTAFFSYYDKCILFQVVDVIPCDVNMKAGGSYTYSPVVYSSNSNYKTFTWTSNNTAVATVDSKGKVNAVAPGTATITCTANGGIKFKSVVTVSNQLTQQVKLNIKSKSLNVGETVQLTATISPSNTTNKAVKWLSSNENIAQVDDSGKITAIGAGYCSIYVKADDGSGKFDKCLVHVNGPAAARGDINGDGAVNLSDAKMVVDIFVGNE